MNALKNSTLQAAGLAAAMVVALSLAGQAATAKTEARHPDMVSRAFGVLEQAGQYTPASTRSAAGKGDLLVQRSSCSAWPYVATECRTGMAALRSAPRTITIERRGSDAASTLVRVPADDRLAAR